MQPIKRNFEILVESGKVDLNAEIIKLKEGYSDNELREFMKFVRVSGKYGFLRRYAIEKDGKTTVYKAQNLEGKK